MKKLVAFHTPKYGVIGTRIGDHFEQRWLPAAYAIVEGGAPAEAVSVALESGGRLEYQPATDEQRAEFWMTPATPASAGDPFGIRHKAGG